MLAGAMTVALADLDDRQESAEIEAWVTAHPDSTPFHRPAWIQAVARGTRQKAAMLVCRHGGAIAGVLPLNRISSVLFGRALVSSGFAVDGGILADDLAAAQALADACWRQAERWGCTTAELRGGMLPEDGWAHKNDAYLGFSKPLEADDEAQLVAIPKRHRAEVRRGLDNQPDIQTGREELLDVHYRLYAENVHRLGTPVFPKALFSNVLSAFGQDADIMVASKDGVPVTSVISLYHRGRCMPYWHGASGQARALRSNEAAYFRLMSHARRRGCTMFDFGRSKIGTGPAAWKKTWGWEGVPLTYAVRAAPGHEVRDINPLSPQYRRKVELWKKLPLGLANLIGPHIARGLG